MSDIDPIVRDVLDRTVPTATNVAPDWDDVLRRAEPKVVALPARPRRRVWYALAAAALLTALLVNPAFGIGSRVLDFFEGSPAPERVKKSFADFNPPSDIVAQFQNSGAHVLADEAQGMIALETSEGTAYLWAAPTETGDWCSMVEYPTASSDDAPVATGGGAATCQVSGPPDPLAVGFGAMGAGEDQLVLLHGRVRAAATSARVRFADGDEEPLALTREWFLYEVPSGKDPVAVVAFDASGELVAREAVLIETFEPGPAGEQPLPEPVRREVFSIETRGGFPVTLTRHTSIEGTPCFDVTAELGGAESGACYTPRGNEIVWANVLEAGQEDTQVIVLYGVAADRVASLELIYEDGESVPLRLVDGYFMLDLPPEHQRIGHLPKTFIARGVDGTIVGRQPAGQPRF